MQTIKLMQAACALWVIVSFSQAIAAPVGATAGDFSVDPNGGANYSIPITLPPGSSDMAPDISLNYHSQAGSGLSGIGWAISGLSIISRCGRTIAIDGIKGGVSYDANDRFCLNGQRLIAVSGVYGASGTEYRTERETFSRVFSYGAAGAGPAYFRVWNKSGEIVEYGNTFDSAIEAQGRTAIRHWAINKMQDRHGNYYTVTYSENNANGEYHPTRVDYTGNNSSGTAPYNAILFEYLPRTDVVSHYEGGSLIRFTQRLTRIKTYSSATLVGDYQLEYDYNGARGASRLLSVRECGSDGTCLNPTTFAWQGEGGGWGASQSQGGLHRDGAVAMWFVDVNGDGKPDYVAKNNDGTIHWNLSTGTGWGPPLSQGGLHNVGNAGTWFMDINGDGKADYVAKNQGDGCLHWNLSIGTGWAPSQTQCGLHLNGSVALWLVDINGDGMADYVTKNNDGIIHWNLSTGTGWAPSQSQGGLHNVGNAGTWFVDINGDGMADFVAQNQGDGCLHWNLSTGTGWAPSQSQCGLHNNGSVGMWFVDINGDGMADYVTKNNDGVIHWNLSTGTGWAPSQSQGGLHNVGNAGTWFVDINGDGMADFVAKNQAEGYLHWNLSTGTGWGPSQSQGGLHYNGSAGMWLEDIDGDGKADYVAKNNDDFLHWNSSAYNSVRLTSVSNGLGAVTNINYKSLTDNSVYTKDSNAVYPVQDVQGPTYVVSGITQSDGIGGLVSTRYNYAGGKNHLKGGGWLGFRMSESTQDSSATVTRSFIHQNYENGLTGLPDYTETRIGGILVTRQESYWLPVNFGNGRTLVSLATSITRNYEINGSQISCERMDNFYSSFNAAGNYGDYANPYQTVNRIDTNCSFALPFTKTSVSAFTHDAANWVLAKPNRITVTSAAPGMANQTRIATFSYNMVTGKVVSETVEPGSSISVTTTHTYDVFGNQVSSTVSGPNFATRTSSTVYDNLGRFPMKSTNALGHTQTYEYDGRFGDVTKLTGPNGIATTWAYDGFGRKIKETRGDGTSTTVTYAFCDVSCPSLARYSVLSQASGSAPVKVYIDMLGRTLRTQTQRFDGTSVYQDTNYDNRGRVWRASQPYASGETVLWTRNTFDALNRVRTTTAPDNSVTTINYNGLTTSVTNALFQTATTVKNAAGQVARSTDTNGASTTFVYDANANLIQSTDAAGHVITMQYDQRGRKLAMNDPDLGNWRYTYNAIGELLTQTDAKNQVTSMTYDLLGRIKTRTSLEGISTWSYDSAIKGIGKIASVTGPDSFSETYSYDTLGRPIQVATFINGVSYTTATAYDSLGRVATQTYPETGFRIKNVYNAYGYLSEIRNAATNALYWHVHNINSQGQLTQEAYGNGLITDYAYHPLSGLLQAIKTGTGAGVQNLAYTFDALGNLKTRSDAKQAVTETFSYDNLNRLISVTGPSSKSYSYDSIGNIMSKSDVGTYIYGGARPHAVTATSGVLNSTYAYDGNGNMISGAGRTFTYTSFNKPRQITAGGVTHTFSYDSDKQRIVKKSSSSETVYIGKHYEKVTQGSLIQRKHYISGSSGVVAVYTARTSGVNDTRYLHKDHLGSIDVITNEAGAVVERLSFDAHGKRRQSNWQPSTGAIASLTPRGYTGHEMDDASGLINMNAREYDPLLGRFLTPDSIIQSPLSSQGMNRYAYVDNNPLSFTDPSGNSRLKKHHNAKYRNMFAPTPKNTFEFIKTLPNQKKIDTYIATHSWAYTTGQIVATVFTAAYCGGCGSAAGAAYYTYVATGSMNEATKAGAISYAVSYINSYFSGGYPTYTGVENLAKTVGQGLVRAAVAEVAKDKGISPLVFNLSLIGLSHAGNQWTESRYDPGSNSFAGVGNRGITGLPFDVVDVLLAYQGFRTASQSDYLKWRAWMGAGNASNVSGHSLGALEASNLAAQGFGTASVESMPFLNIAGTATSVSNGGLDLVNGGVFGQVFNPRANLVWGWTMFHMRNTYVP